MDGEAASGLAGRPTLARVVTTASLAGSFGE
jgi:hypothetical protein